MRRVFKGVLLTLVLVIVAMGSALTAMRFAIHGREVTVPKFVGMTPADAERAAAANGLLLIRESRFYSNDVPEGRIVSQAPTPGAKVRRGWRVRLAESLGPQRMTIPDLVGQTPRAAEIDLRRRGLEMGAVAQLAIAGKAADQVIAQSPPANAQGVASPRISLLVSAPEQEKAFVMPDLTGVHLADASITVTDAGMKVGTVTTAKVDPSATTGRVAEPTVIRHNPAAGQRVQPGAIVNLEVVR